MNKDVMQKMGQDLGMSLVMTCPAFMKFSMELAQDEGQIKKMMEKKEIKKGFEIPPPSPLLSPTVSTQELKATLLSLNVGDVSSISVKESNGKISKVYWMEYFENADDFRDNMKNYLSKKVIVRYTEKEIYGAASKTYKTIKIIVSIDLQ